MSVSKEAHGFLTDAQEPLNEMVFAEKTDRIKDERP